MWQKFYRIMPITSGRIFNSVSDRFLAKYTRGRVCYISCLGKQALIVFNSTVLHLIVPPSQKIFRKPVLREFFESDK